MSKRSRRLRRPNLPPEAFNSPTASVSATPANAGTTATPVKQVTEINWSEEYSEVLGDLKRTAILAVSMISIMGVLSFIIR